ncbi:hypothetical protein D1872_51190 [compost metagenome]
MSDTRLRFSREDMVLVKIAENACELHDRGTVVKDQEGYSRYRKMLKSYEGLYVGGYAYGEDDDEFAAGFVVIYKGMEYCVPNYLVAKSMPAPEGTLCDLSPEGWIGYNKMLKYVDVSRVVKEEIQDEKG